MPIPFGRRGTRERFRSGCQNDVGHYWQAACIHASVCMMFLLRNPRKEHGGGWNDEVSCPLKTDAILPWHELVVPGLFSRRHDDMGCQMRGYGVKDEVPSNTIKRSKDVLEIINKGVAWGDRRKECGLTLSCSRSQSGPPLSDDSDASTWPIWIENACSLESRSIRYVLTIFSRFGRVCASRSGWWAP